MRPVGPLGVPARDQHGHLFDLERPVCGGNQE